MLTPQNELFKIENILKQPLKLIAKNVIKCTEQKRNRVQKTCGNAQKFELEENQNYIKIYMYIYIIHHLFFCIYMQWSFIYIVNINK